MNLTLSRIGVRIRLSTKYSELTAISIFPFPPWLLRRNSIAINNSSDHSISKPNFILRPSEAAIKGEKDH